LQQDSVFSLPLTFPAVYLAALFPPSGNRNLYSIDIFAELRSFLSGYFHEDWELDSSEPDEVISQFLDSKPNPNYVAKIASQIEVYLSSESDEQILKNGLLKNFGCYYLPSADSLKTSYWLNHVANFLRNK
jgi:hypothetical protein